jgi:uncharacterized membrane protein (DUF373 family)
MEAQTMTTFEGRGMVPARATLWPRTVVGAYERFEQLIVLILTGLIALIVVAAVWDLTVNVVSGLVVNRTLDPTDHAVFRSVFGMILTVIIALEFKRSILVQTERTTGIVAARSVILIGLLAMVRKIILDLGDADAMHMIAFAAVILALGAVYWLVRDQDRKEHAADA